MITFQSGKLIIPEDERFVGFAGDNHSNTKQILLPDTDDTAAVYSLYLKFDDGRVTSAPLSAVHGDDGVVLTWSIASQHLLKAGIIMAQLKIAGGDGGVEHSGWDYFIAASSAEFDDDGVESDILSRTEFEKRMAEAVRDAKATAPYIGDDGCWYVYSSAEGDYVRSVSANSITVDSAVSSQSGNPVENRAVKAYVDAADAAKADKATTLAGYGITDAYTKTQVDGLIPAVPTKTSDLTNDSGFLTAHQDISGKMDRLAHVNSAAQRQALSNGQLFEQQGEIGITDENTADGYTLLAKKSNIPIKTSDLTNDSGFLTAHQNISGKMNLAIASVPASGDAPDTTSPTYTALSDGQIFQCYISGNLTYWVKFTVAPGTSSAEPSPYRIALFDEIPTYLSQLTNDCGYIDALPLIPTQMSELIDDVGYIRDYDLTQLTNYVYSHGAFRVTGDIDLINGTVSNLSHTFADIVSAFESGKACELRLYMADSGVDLMAVLPFCATISYNSFIIGVQFGGNCYYNGNLLTVYVDITSSGATVHQV